MPQTAKRYQRELARAQGVDVGLDRDHVVLVGCFQGNSWAQGLGYTIDTEFLRRFMRVFGVDRLSAVEGKPCWVLREEFAGPIVGLEPLLEGDGGEVFIFAAWEALR